MSNESGFIVRVYSGSTCSGTPVHTSAVIPPTTNNYVLPYGVLTNGGTYSWTVQAIGDGIHYRSSAPSSCCRFTVSTSGYAIQFRGRGNIQGATAAASSAFTPAIGTWEAWTYLPSLSRISNSDVMSFMGNYTPGAGWGMGFYQLSSAYGVGFGGYTINSLPFCAKGVTTLVLNTWKHVAATFDGYSYKMYYDGTLLATTVMPAQPRASTAVFSCGAELSGLEGPFGFGGTTPYFDLSGAMIDEIKISNNVRYNGSFIPQKTLGSDANTIAYWRFNEGQGLTVADPVGSHTLTLYGDPGYGNPPTWVNTGVS